MKGSEKLFLLINEIDETLIENAKPQEERPISMKPEPRSPIKGIIALAACVAVLAVGVFMLVKFRIGGVAPIDGDSSEYSSDDNLSDNSTSDDSSYPKPDIELTFTEEDKELQALLKDLTANAEDIDTMFYKMSIINGEPDIKASDYGYYLIPEDLRTEPNGLHTVPQTCDEMEKLICRYFSKRAADFYLYSDNICKGSIAEDADGTLTVLPDDKFTISNPTFIEIDGRLYRLGAEWNSTGLNLGIDCETAKVTHRTDRSIEFSFWGYNYTALSEGGEVYSERDGALVYEDGGWKLNYFYHNGFIPEMPNEYTEQDLELQAILETLKPGEDVRALFSINSASAYGDMYSFILPGNHEPEGSYQYYIDVSGPQPSVKHPKSLDELEEMLLEYFTQEKTDYYMSDVCNGTMTDNGDGTYTVTLDKDLFLPAYIEIDGKMFYRICGGSGSGYHNNTAKVVEWTDDTIIYSYVVFESFVYGTRTGALKYERGGWKMN